MDFLLPLIGGALGAALINGVVALYRLHRESTVEHWQWLREKKLTSYIAFLDCCRALDKYAWSAKKSRRKERLKEFGHLLQSIQATQIRLLAPEEVAKEAEELLASVVAVARLAAQQGLGPNDERFMVRWEEYIQKRLSIGELLRADLRTSGQGPA